MKKFSLAALLAVSTAMPVTAFDTGYHMDATYRAMKMRGFGETSIQVAQVMNWMVDYYSTGHGVTPGDVKKQMDLLHFDNLSSAEEVDLNWRNLMKNTEDAFNIVLARDDYDAHKKARYLLAYMGMTLHALQDFYTHSNWNTFFVKIDGAYNTNTYMRLGGVPGTTNSDGKPLQSGYYPDKDDCVDNCNNVAHGDYDSGLNKDSQIRPDWDEAFVFAYIESYRFMFWAQERIPADLWSEMQRLSPNHLGSSRYDDLKDDWQAAIDISMLIDLGGQDGHWKGNLSGSNSSFAEEWGLWDDDSYWSELVKDHKIQENLIACLYKFSKSGCQNPPVLRQRRETPDQKIVDIQVVEVKAESHTIDIPDDPDFYAKFVLGDDYQTYIDRVLQGKKSYKQSSDSHNAPAYRALFFTDAGNSKVDLKIELYDQDTNSNDDHIDISDHGDNLNLTYYFEHHGFTVEGGSTVHVDRSASDTRTSKGSGAEIKFFINDYSLAPN